LPLVKTGRILLNLVVLLLFAGAGTLQAANESNFYGPRAFSAGQVSSLFRDVWSVQNNPGALGYLERNAAAVSYERRYSAFSMLAFSAACSFKNWGTFGLAASRFGPEFFNQSRAGLSWGKSFGIASIGVQGQWYQVSSKDFNSRHYFLLNFGGIARLGEKLHFSGSISNLTQTKSQENETRVLPTILNAGLSLQANSNLLILLEIQKDLDEKAGVNAGAEYRFAGNCFARTGFSTLSKTASLGFGLFWRDMQLDFGSSWHPELGFSQCIGLQYLFGKAQYGKPSQP